MMIQHFTHFDEKGAAHMVDVGSKAHSQREAAAEGQIHVGADAFRMIADGTAQKGDVLGVSRIAGIMAAKKTSEIIPLCHPVQMTSCTVDFTLDAASFCVHCTCTVRCTGQTGVEMEALHGVTAALLTIYDMCKAVNRGMEIGCVRLVHKAGGKSGAWTHEK